MEKQQPKLRFPEFEEDWGKVKLKDVSTYFNGGSFENDVKEEGKYELITLKSIDVSGNLAHSKRYLDIEIPTLSKNTLIMILSEQSPGLLGMTALIPIDNRYVLNQRVAEIRPSSKVESYFLSLAINRNQHYFSKLGAGTKVQNISKPNVENYEFLCPFIPEQTKIANFLSAVDEKLNLLKEKKEALETYKKGIMQKIFNQEIRFKNDNGNDFDDWNKVILSEVFDYKKGNGLSKDKLDKNGMNKCILYGELYTKYSEVIFDVISKTNSNEGLLSEKGDLLIPSSTTTSGIDLANVTALNFGSILLGGDITVLRSNQEVNSIFYAYYLSNHKKEEIASYAQGITIVHLYYSHIKDMIIDFPDIKEQTKIANFLSAIDEKINLVTSQIKDTQEYKKGLLQQMFV